jgi:hypothetical protein
MSLATIFPPFGGIELGAGVRVLFGAGDPNLVADVNATLSGATIGSTYQRTDAPDATHALYVKTSLPNIWTNK